MGKNQTLSFRCTEAERRAIVAAADLAGGSTQSAFILGAIRHEIARRAQRAFQAKDDAGVRKWVRVGVFLQEDFTLDSFGAEVRKERAVMGA